MYFDHVRFQDVSSRPWQILASDVWNRCPLNDTEAIFWTSCSFSICNNAMFWGFMILWDFSVELDLGRLTGQLMPVDSFVSQKNPKCLFHFFQDAIWTSSRKQYFCFSLPLRGVLKVPGLGNTRDLSQH